MGLPESVTERARLLMRDTLRGPPIADALRFVGPYPLDESGGREGV